MDVVEIEVAHENIEEGVKAEEGIVVKISEGRSFEYCSSIIVPLIAGDFFHNFCDGILIGAAFKCSAYFAWKVCAMTVAHKLAQEISDFAILTEKLEFSVSKALFYNVMSGMSVVLGGAAIIAADINDVDLGLLLAFGAGNFIFLATTQLFPVFFEDDDSKEISVKERLYTQLMNLLWFCVGCIAIGLVLLDHEHCVTSEGESGGDGHHDH